MTFLSPFLPHLLRLGDPVAEDAGKQLGKKLGGRSWETAKNVWDKLTLKIEARSIVEGAAAALAIDPTDKAAQTVLSEQLTQALLNNNYQVDSDTTGINQTVRKERHSVARARDTHYFGSVCEKHPKEKEGESDYRRTLGLFEAASDCYSTAREYRCRGDIAKATENWEEAVQWYQKAISASLSSNDSRGASTAYSLLAQVYIATERGPDALSVCISVLALDMEHNEDLIGFDIHVLGQLLKQVGINEFQSLWHVVTAAPCPAQLLEMTQQASQLYALSRNPSRGKPQ